MTPPMLRQLRHDMWATERLLEHCRALSPPPLDLTVPGTYGTIRRTFAHIVRADERYLEQLGLVRRESLLDLDSATLADVAAHLDTVKAAVEKLFAGAEFEPDRWIPDTREASEELQPWTMVAQFVHHGSDHRAHIGTILGAHGLESPLLDVWTYGWETGAIRQRR
jgi:uncharacterized damage-inducible protein DinB